jgi:flagellar biosynthesis anti-sigma factor FlgM
MKINDSSRINQAMSSYQKSHKIREQKDGAKGAEPSRDDVTISPEALQRARELQGADRHVRIQEVKRSIADGTYRVPSDAVVRKMLEAYGES